MTREQAFIKLMDAQIRSGKRSVPAYTKVELKMIPKALKVLGLYNNQNVYNYMEIEYLIEQSIDMKKIYFLTKKED